MMSAHALSVGRSPESPNERLEVNANTNNILKLVVKDIESHTRMKA